MAQRGESSLQAATPECPTADVMAGADYNGFADDAGSDDHAEHAGNADHAGLKCVAEERFADINLVQDVMQDPVTNQRLVCGFKVQSPLACDLPLTFCCQCGVLIG